MTRRQHLDERHDPKLQFTRSSSAVSYHFRGKEGWAICTVNDTTGELSIQSDWGSWQHRWSADPKHLGAPTLTAFLRDRKAVDYLYDKLHYGRTRGKFSAEATIAALREYMVERYADHWCDDGDQPLPREKVEERIKDDARLGEAWYAFDEVKHCDGWREFFERLSSVVTDLITDTPWEHIQEEEPWASTVLREAILPAFIAALNATAETEAQP